jgi:uncharacterized membrane protein
LIPRTYEAIVPDYLAAKRALVYACGVAEMAGGAGLLHPRARALSSWWCIATLIGVFPANAHMALHPQRYRRVPGGRPSLVARLPLQACSSVGPERRDGRPPSSDRARQPPHRGRVADLASGRLPESIDLLADDPQAWLIRRDQPRPAL